MAEQLKDRFFQKPFLDNLGKQIKRHYPKFDRKRFMELVRTGDWEKAALKDRMHIVAAALGETLPSDFGKAVAILLKVEKEFGRFDHLVFADYVEQFGLDDFQLSVEAIEVFTRSSAEFAVRPFIQKYPYKMMKQMLKWSRSSDENVRRLASEGCRPRLPWGMALQQFKQDPTPILPILENLKDDPSEYVRRSVANNLNDISKDHPQLVLKLAKQWKGKSRNTDKLLKHALRGLLKQGDKRAMQLFGFGSTKDIKIKNLDIKPRKIQIGKDAQFTFDLGYTGSNKHKIRLEYSLAFITSTGKPATKVFQISEAEYTPGEKRAINRKISFKQRSTRKYYPGKHSVMLVVNGEDMGKVEFELV